MDFEYSPYTREMLARLQTFMEDHVLPANRRFHELAAQGDLSARGGRTAEGQGL